MSMNETLDKGLDGAFKECVHHLDSITRDNVGIGGLALEFNFDDNHTYTCTRKLTKPLYVESRDFTIEDFSVIFEVTGKISSTKTVHHSQHGAVDSYTFWVESQPTRLSRALWNRIPEALQAIATRAEFPFDISQVYEKDQSTGKVSLKVKWASNEPSCLFNSPNGGKIPAFTNGALGPLALLYDVPVQVLLNITHGFEDKDSGEVVLSASLLSINGL